MKIISWNVNGLRAVIKKDFFAFLEKEKPDFLCVQEIKISEAARVKELSEMLNPEKIGYEIYWNSAERPGYSGTAIFSKRSYTGIGCLENLDWDNEGRIQVLDIGGYYLANVYFPNSNHELTRLDFKIDFNDKLLRYFKKLEEKKPVIVTGDYNVAHNEIDLARPKDNIGSPGFHPREREWMDRFLAAGFADTFRELHPEKIQYSWWSYRAGARRKNIGWRIDYFCVSAELMKNIKKAYILNEVIGSDHCPVGVEII